MASYKNILLNFCVAAAIFAAVLTLAFLVDQLLYEELAVILAAVLVFPLSILLLKRFFPGREPIALAVVGLTTSAGMAGLSSAPYINPTIQMLFFGAFLLVFGFLFYLAYALFSTVQIAQKSD